MLIIGAKIKIRKQRIREIQTVLIQSIFIAEISLMAEWSISHYHYINNFFALEFVVAI